MEFTGRAIPCALLVHDSLSKPTEVRQEATSSRVLGQRLTSGLGAPVDLGEPMEHGVLGLGGKPQGDII